MHGEQADAYGDVIGPSGGAEAVRDPVSRIARQDLQCGWSWYTEEGSQEAKSGESTLLKFERMEKASNGEELDIATLLLSFFIATNITYDSLNN